MTVCSNIAQQANFGSYVQEASWHEDNWRIANGDQVARLVAQKPSAQALAETRGRLEA
jgi:hypothetical protein